MRVFTRPVTLSSPLAEIAKDIGEQYLLRPFPIRTLSNGLLDYDSLRTQNLDKSKLHRSIHGYQNACRFAALIPVLFAFYKKHVDEFTPELQNEIHAMTDDQIKKIQIVGLMRAAGRTQDYDSGYKFAQQGKKECLHYLKELGLNDEKEREYLADAIVKSEGCKAEDYH